MRGKRRVDKLQPRGGCGRSGSQATADIRLRNGKHGKQVQQAMGPRPDLHDRPKPQLPQHALECGVAAAAAAGPSPPRLLPRTLVAAILDAVVEEAEPALLPVLDNRAALLQPPFAPHSIRRHGEEVVGSKLSYSLCLAMAGGGGGGGPRWFVWALALLALVICGVNLAFLYATTPAAPATTGGSAVVSVGICWSAMPCLSARPSICS